MAAQFTAPVALPRFKHSDPALVAWAEALVRALQIELQRLAAPAGATAYTLTNATPVRTLDPTTATLPELAQVVAALITDHKSKGTIA